MTTLRPSEAAKSAASSASRICLFLVYGENAGLVSETIADLARALSQGRDKAEILHLDADAVAADPQALLDEAYAVSMFSQTRIARISVGRKSLMQALEPLLHEPPPEFFLILESGALRKDAPLRMRFEITSHAAAIECLPDTERDHIALIDAEARAAKATLAPDARSLLVSLLPTDRLAARAEVLKLFLYAGPGANISLRDVQDAISNGAELAVQALVDAACLGDMASFNALAERYLADDFEPGTILASLLWHALMLHRARAAMDAGASAGAAASSAARYGLYFKRGPAFEKQLAKFESRGLLELIQRIDRITAQSRRLPRLAAASAAGLFGHLAARGARIG